MEGHRVTFAVVLAIVGGILVLAQGIDLLVSGEISTFFTLQSGAGSAFPFGLGIGLTGIFGIVVGVCMLAGVYLMSSPPLRDIGAVILLIFSLLSLVAGGGWFVGLGLGVLSGILGLFEK